MKNSLTKKVPKAGLNVTFSESLIEILIQHYKINHFIISPGSRNTPLVAAIIKHPTCQKHSVLDERSAGFMAVGIARAGQRAAVVTTSGTAVANLLPAMIEASADQLFIMALTADRPEELHGIGENQCIEQRQIFSSFAQFNYDLAAPDSASEIESTLHSLLNQRHKFLKEKKSDASTVHINVRFKKPLEPIYSNEHEHLKPKIFAKSSISKDILKQETLSNNMKIIIQDFFKNSKKPLLIIGGLKMSERSAALEIARHLQWPTYSDILSGLPREQSYPRIHSRIHHCKDFFENSGFDACLFLGTRVVFPQILDSIKQSKIQTLQIHPEKGVFDPRQIVTHKLEQSIETIKKYFIKMKPLDASNKHAQRFINADKFLKLHSPKQAQLNDRQSFSNLNQCFEATSIDTIIDSLQEKSSLFLGNSMVIRDADMYACSLKDKVNITANRGASGIDGNIATSIGLCLAFKEQCTAIIGDLTFLHDVGSLLSLMTLKIPLRIFVINNRGGGIFSHLPISKHKNVMEPWINTPQKTQISYLCEGYILPYEKVKSFNHLLRICNRKIEKPEVIEIRTDKNINFIHHQAMKKESIALLSRFSNTKI